MDNRSQYKAFLLTPYWKEVSRLVKKRYGWRCGVCNSPQDLETHHRTYENRGDELNHLDDLICLCKKCHQMFHDAQKKEAKKVLKEIRSHLYRELAAQREEREKRFANGKLKKTKPRKPQRARKLKKSPRPRNINI